MYLFAADGHVFQKLIDRRAVYRSSFSDDSKNVLNRPCQHSHGHLWQTKSGMRDLQIVANNLDYLAGRAEIDPKRLVIVQAGDRTSAASEGSDGQAGQARPSGETKP